MSLSKFAVIALSLTGLLVFTGCEDDEANSIAKAQQCFDNITDTDANTAASSCLTIISGLDSPDANIVRCGLLIREGGLTSTALIAAYTSSDGAATNEKEAAFMNALTLSTFSSGSSTTNQASLANTACQKSGLSGLAYLGTLVLVGTNVNSVGAGDFGTRINACVADTANCANAELGTALVAAESLYCSGGAADEQVCIDLNNAISTGGSNFELIAQTFLNAIDYN